MIYLIVGQPRSAKSQYAVKISFDINDQNNRIQKKLDEGKELKDDELMPLPDGTLVPAIRKIYSDIDEHALRNEFVNEAPDDWRQVPDGSSIFYDEVHFRKEFLDQNKYMSQDPMIVDLSTHGHRNIDIYLITQDPRRLEKSIRALIFKMYLVKRPANLPPFANIYTFDRWLGDPWAASKNPDNVHDTYKFIYKKKYQDAYKSASAHTSIKFKLQNKFIWALIAIVLMACLATYLFKISGMGKLVKDATNASKITKDTSVDPNKIMDSAYKKHTQEQNVQSASSPVATDPQQTSPEYNQNRTVQYDINKPYDFDQSQYQYQVTEQPQLAGCMQYKNTCNCYTQQATKINMSVADCKRYLSGDRPFNPFRQPQQYNQQSVQQQQIQQPVQQQQTQPVLTPSQFDAEYMAKMQEAKRQGLI